MIRGIILAAGASSRMGRAKAALTLGHTGETLVSRVIRTMLSGGAPEVIVVAGAHVDDVRNAMPAQERRARMVEHPGWRQGQLSSLLAGLAAIDDPQLEGALVTLVDVPLVRSSTVAAVIAEWRRTRAPIVRPANGERHGHPVMFDASVFQDLREADPNVGAKAVFAKHRLRIVNIEVNDPGAFEDIDTPQEYDDLRSKMSDC
ncbi:MAG TPA: nucleotidyltransferase family protein [Vicinamibacterales bacterium]|nr:nucleotidyltransferase family protein [Vicinamibacterales bacterium]